MYIVESNDFILWFQKLEVWGGGSLCNMSCPKIRQVELAFIVTGSIL
jgi:hypothetical protein